VKGRKRRNPLFSKNTFFAENAFCDFLLCRAYAKMKKYGRKMPCPQYNFLCVTQKVTFFAKQAGR
jgi:hypothetical protein